MIVANGAEAAKARYHWLKAHGICVQCGQADAEPGRTKCPACREAHRKQCHKWAVENAEYLRDKRRQWMADHPEYNREYQRRYRQENRGAGRLVVHRKIRLHKPDGTCRRVGCWESAIEFSCWCPEHLREMRERRWIKDFQRLSVYANMAKYSRPNGW